MQSFKEAYVRQFALDHGRLPALQRNAQAERSWAADNIELTTAGLYIGAATSQLVFNRLYMRREPDTYASRFVLADHAPIWRSEAIATPYRACGRRLAVARLAAFIDANLSRAGVGRDQIDSGAIVLAGDVADPKENTAALGCVFGDESERFVCISTGSRPAIGAAQFALQVSGDSVWVTNHRALPIRNVPVLALDLDLSWYIDPELVAAAIERAHARFDLTEGEQVVALAFRWRGDPSHGRLKALAIGIRDGLPRTIDTKKPLILTVDSDIGRSLGAILCSELQTESDVFSVDGVRLNEFDYVDIGAPIALANNVVPLVVKSLLFSPERQGAGVT